MDLSKLTEAELRDARPDLVEAITSGVDVAAAREEGHAEGLKTGAAGERERIRAVRAQSIAGHEALIEELAFDGETTGPEAAVRVIEAEKEARGKRLVAAREDAPDAVKVDDPPEDSGESFEALVAAAMAQGASRKQAVQDVVAQHPEAHRAYLDRINGRAA